MRRSLWPAGLFAILAGTAAIGWARQQAPAPAAPTASLADVRKWIEKGNAEWVDGFRRADAAPIASSFAEDAVNVAADGTYDRGREAILSRMTAYLKTTGPASEARVDIGDLVVDGDLAYEWGRADGRFSGKTGGPTRRTGRYLTCWKRQADGSWKIFRNNSLPMGIERSN